MTRYHRLAEAKDNARRAKDHYETIRAIVESQIVTNGKNAEDRKRDLIVGLSASDRHRDALDELRNAEYRVDQAQADIDQAEAERREHEWQIRQRLAEALGGQHEDTSFDLATDRRLIGRAKARVEMDELFSP